MKTRIVCVLLCALLAAGCATVGKKMDMQAVQQLQRGVARLEDAVALLGPFDAEATSGDMHTYGWSWAKVNGLTGKIESQAVFLTFDTSGRLASRATSGR